MALIIDPRLLEPNGEVEITEDFNRVLKIVDEGGGGGSGLPEVTEEDNGKILVAEDSEWKIKTPASGLPETTTEDAGKFLMVDENGNWAAQDIPLADNMTF